MAGASTFRCIFFRELLLKAGEAVRNRLMAVLGPERRDLVRQIVEEMSTQVAHQAPAARNIEAAQRLVQALKEQGRLKEPDVLAFAQRGKLDEVIASLALLCAVSCDLVDRLLRSGRADAVLVPCKAMNFGWPTARAILEARKAARLRRTGSGERRDRIPQAVSAPRRRACCGSGRSGRRRRRKAAIRCRSQPPRNDIGEPRMGAEHRKLPRRKVEQLVLMTSDNGSIIGQCVMLDVSAGGARLKLNGDFAVPEQFTLFLSKIDGRLKRRCVIAWRKEKQIGVRFMAAEDAAAPAARTA